MCSVSSPSQFSSTLFPPKRNAPRPWRQVYFHSNHGNETCSEDYKNDVRVTWSSKGVKCNNQERQKFFLKLQCKLFWERTLVTEYTEERVSCRVNYCCNNRSIDPRDLERKNIRQVRREFEEACSIIAKDSRLATLPKSETKVRKCVRKFKGTVRMLLLGTLRMLLLL
jgi:hypothetical protein